MKKILMVIVTLALWLLMTSAALAASKAPFPDPVEFFGRENLNYIETDKDGIVTYRFQFYGSKAEERTEAYLKVLLQSKYHLNIHQELNQTKQKPYNLVYYLSYDGPAKVKETTETVEMRDGKTIKKKVTYSVELRCHRKKADDNLIAVHVYPGFDTDHEKYTGKSGTSDVFLPDPVVFFGEEALKDAAVYSSKFSWFYFSSQKTEQTAEDYVNLLLKDKYQMSLACTDHSLGEDGTSQYFHYNGTAKVSEKYKENADDKRFYYALVVRPEKNGDISIGIAPGFDFDYEKYKPTPTPKPKKTPKPTSTPKPTGKSDDDFWKDCSACTGGRCTSCGGRKGSHKNVPGSTERVWQDCLSCFGSGKCTSCGGSGFKR